MPLVSVIMPVRDGEPYIAAAVRSVLTQTLTDLELVVVDDGSVDSSIESARSVADSRVTFLEGPKRGQETARNLGVAHSSAPWIAFMDQDDLSVPSRLSEQLERLTDESEDLSAVGCLIRAIDELGDRIVESPQLQHPDAIAAAAYSFMPIGGPTLMVSRRAFDRVAGFPEEPEYVGVGDYELVCRLLRAGARIANVGKTLYLHRWHAASMSRNRRGHMEKAAAAVRDRHWQLASPRFSVEQIRQTRAGEDSRLHASVFAQLAIGCGRHAQWGSATRIALTTAISNPRGVLALAAERRSRS